MVLSSTLLSPFTTFVFRNLSPGRVYFVSFAEDYSAKPPTFLLYGVRERVRVRDRDRDRGWVRDRVRRVRLTGEGVQARVRVQLGLG